ncbi:AMP-binding protein [Catellatospora vulcania]|uniref:AMP-binding protein n=1 Tax=Catellatospora vulcania TaxID=1460450 RepID=UPI0018AFA248|nr:AMP-binding protein [Catellatospora vulcania]
MTSRTLPELLAALAAARPEHVALQVAGGEGAGPTELTAAAWHARATAAGNGLLGKGVAPGDRVGLVFDGADWLDFAVAYAAVTGIGAVAVPLSATSPAARLRELLDHAGARVVVGTLGWTLSELDAEDATPLPDTVRPGQTAQIVYTSGTTGTPKGVAASHASLTHGLDPARPPLAHSRHALHAFPLGTNAAQTMLVTALVARPTLVTIPAFDPWAYARTAQTLHVGTLFLVPAMASALLEAGVFERCDLDAVQLVSCTAAALPPAVARALADALPEAVIVNNYTSTEAAPAYTSMVFDPDRPASVGRAEGGAELRILDADGAIAGPGQTGEVWLRAGDAVRAYHGDPGASAAVFRDGWVRMGDLGYRDADGYLFLVDRESDLVNAGAHRVSTLRVEAALHEHPAVLGAAVLGLPHPVMGATVAAAVELRDPSALAGLRAFLADRLAPYELPTRIVAVAELPRNDGGKVRKAALRELFTQAPARVAPRTEAEVALAGLWREVLRVPEVGVGDDFFALGGDSTRATRLAALITTHFGRDIPLSLIFDTPLLADQAEHLSSAPPTAEPPPPLPPLVTPTPTPTPTPMGDDRCFVSESEVGPQDLTRISDHRQAAEPAESGGSGAASGEMPLASTQESMLAWMWATGEPRDVGPISVGIRVRDQLDPGLLERALSAVADRHEALRTVFDRDPAGRHRARVLDHCPPVVTAVAARDLDHAGQLCRADREGGFDTERGPLVRAMVAGLGPEDHVLGLAVHHLVCDGASMGPLLHEIGVAYAALRSGSPLPAAAPGTRQGGGHPPTAAAEVTVARGSGLPPATPLRDFVAYTRQRWQTTLPYWRRVLDGAPAHLEPFRGRREAVRLRTAQLEFALPGTLGDGLRRAAAAQGATPFMLIASCWAAALSERTGTHDILLMSPVPGRTRPGSEALIGCLSQSLLLRVDTSGGPSAAELLARTRRTVVDALDHQHYPFAEFYQRHTGAAWLRVETWGGQAHLPGLESEPFELPRALDADWPTPGGLPDLQAPELAVVEHPDGRLVAHLLWNHHAFARSEMDILAGRVTELFEHAARELAPAPPQEVPR